MLNRPMEAELHAQNFDAKDYANDARINFELILINGIYHCSLCKHKFAYSNAAVEQLKSAHVRKQIHQ